MSVRILGLAASVVVAAAMVVPQFLAVGPISFATAIAGEWDPVLIDGQVPAINLVVLPDGSLLYWSGLDAAETGLTFFMDDPGAAKSRVMTLTPSGPVISTPTPEDGGHDDLFCSGNTLLADGTVLVAGGSTQYVNIPEGGLSIGGSNAARLFDHDADVWSQAADMNWYRWYPSVVTLPDGSALAASGIRDLGDFSSQVLQVERYDPARDEWTDLPSTADNVLPLYPRLHVIPSGPNAGQVLYTGVGCLYCPFGERPEEALWSLTQRLDLGTNTWTTDGGTVFGARQDGVSVPLALRPENGYKAEYLVATGTAYRTEAAHPLAEIVDASGETTTSTAVAPMHRGRWHPNGVLLPDGQVFVVGGLLNDDVLLPGSPQGVMNGELFDPDVVDLDTGLRGTWTPSPPMQVERGYHGTAVLLPDGRVLVGGHVSFPNPFTHNDVEEQTFETRFEVYEPAYLAAANRPAITSAPANIAYGASFALTADGDYDEVVLVRPGATTHAYDSEQRLVELELTGGGAIAPPNANLAPPGHYMLFVLDDGVPSVAKFVHLS